MMRTPSTFRLNTWTALGSVLAVMGSAACIGTIGGSGDGSGTSGGGSGDANGANTGSPVLTGDTSNADPNAAGPMPLRRLGAVEYQNSVRALFGDNTITATMPNDSQASNGFDTAPLLSTDTADNIRTSAEELAKRVTTNFDALFACDVSKSSEDACAEQFIRRFGRRAYRHTLSADEVSSLLALYHSARTDLQENLEDGIRIVVTAMLQSPRFLYHWESTGNPLVLAGATAQLEPFMLASRLSYFLWSSMPDDALLDAADAGKLLDDASLGQQIDRMLASPAFAATAESFHSQWLGLNVPVQKDTRLFPNFSDQFVASAREETNRFIDHVFLQGDARWSTLLTSNYAEVDKTMAGVYGAAAPASGFAPTTVDPNTRAGLFTRASLVMVDSNASQTSPPRAGKFIWTRVLCNTIGAPPAGATAAFHFDDTLSVRQNFEALQTEPACSSCHAALNPLGFAFESYDPVGKFRTTDGTHPIDASGKLTLSNGQTEPFTNIVDLSRLLADDADATSCVARNWFRFASARMETDADTYALESTFAAFRNAGWDIRVMLKSFAMSHTFRYRAVDQGEVTQ